MPDNPGTAHPFRYYIFGEDYSVTGTNSDKVAAEAGKTEIVLDSRDGVVLGNSTDDREVVIEQTSYVL